MRSFFKIFFASFLSLAIFSLIAFFILVGVISSLASKDKPEVSSKSVLVIDLSQTFHERMQPDLLSALTDEGKVPGLYDVIRLIEHAKSDNEVSGILVHANGNANGFASSNEIRNALIDFRTSKKFVIAHGDMMSQEAYFVANAADRIYVNPAGNFDWRGYSVTLAFIKDMLDKLDIQPQIFYAGKFKSATEMFRTNQMTPENKEQTTAWLNDLYDYFLIQSARSRRLDTAALHQLANNATIQTPQDAVNYKLIDAVKYDDEVKAEIKDKLGIGKTDKMNLLTISDYNEAVNVIKTGKDRIAIIYAEGNIVDGMGSSDNIGGDNYRNIIRKARLDNAVKAIVLRVNSGGGSALASENIWRELQMAKKDGKPVVVSFGDVAASGGYYIACGADSIFASPNTITGSIGVFGIIPNMQGFFKNKLGITFDGVKTSPYADAGGIHRPLTKAEQELIQKSVEKTYLLFKQRVATGRNKDLNYIDSIAQGRVWSGSDAIANGLVDKVGNLYDAVACASRIARISDYGIREYPETRSLIDEILGRNKTEPSAIIKQQLGEDYYRIYQQMIRIKEMSQSVQARLPFEFVMK
jgi:protease IV